MRDAAMRGFPSLFLLLLLFILRGYPTPAEAATAAEKEILLQFKSAVSLDLQGTLSSWTSSPGSDPCRDFAGVTCGASGAIQKILLHGAGLVGILSPALSGLPSLQILSLVDNLFSGGIPSEYAGIATLHKLNLSRNALSGAVPGFLGDLPSLRLLDLSGNSFSGVIPPALFRRCFRLRFVSLARNNLSGGIPTSIGNCAGLVGFDFSFNGLSGGLPEEICRPPGMAFVSLASNSLSETVADKVSSCRSLEFLHLGSNSFDGSPPFDLLALTNLTYFNSSFNNFRGGFPAIGTCGEKLEYLDVSGNALTGVIDPRVAQCRGLRSLSLESNHLGGSIPPEIGGLASLSVLRLGNNEITGAIPPEVGKMEFLMYLDLHNLQLSGEIPSTITNCRFLLQLDASGNRLEGEIPQTLYNMTYLELLDLHSNQLSGSIPATLGNLTKLRYLDLSDNSLGGTIPESLGKLTQLTYLNLSSNALYGAIPSAQTLQQFGAPAFALNAGLCGPPLDTPCSVNPTGGVTSRRTRRLTVSVIIAIAAAAVIFVGVCVITVVNIRMRRRKGRETMVPAAPPSESTTPPSTGSNAIIGKLVLFSKSLPSKYEDWEAGTKALLDKECLVGGGTIGTVFKTTFQGGVSIAVKKLETLGRIRNQEEFEQEIGKLSGLRHPNLVSFQGYYWSSTMQLILSEFVHNGNLHQHLHAPSYSSSGSVPAGAARNDLSWPRRYTIALGTARALSYLHHDCKPQVFHLNVKSTNILLDEEYEPKLSDYGLGKLLPMLGNHAMRKFHRAAGYVAPELASQSMRFSDKCDVYSFGVLCLEVVTGRKPVDRPNGGEVVVLCEYVRSMVERGRARECFDGSLGSSPENELVQVLKLGLICTVEAPSRRPSMAEVVQFLESIRPSTEESR